MPSQTGYANLSIGPGDDAAVLSDGTAISADTLVQGVHWDERFSPSDVGYKAVAVSVSDMAAMGAKPEWMLLCLSLPRTFETLWLTEFSAGLHRASEKYCVELIGGDVTTMSPSTPQSTDSMVVTVTMGGKCVGEPLTRSGAQAGDDIYVTGHLGLAGLAYNLPSPPPRALSALKRPNPPLDFALSLAQNALATAALDLSDGLARDLPRICTASKVGAQISKDLLPTHPELEGTPDMVHFQLSSGEDYQLLFTAPPSQFQRIMEMGKENNTVVTKIGTVTRQNDLLVDGTPWPNPDFSHFGVLS